MLSAPPYVTNESVVTAEQWQALAHYIHQRLWARPSTIVECHLSWTTGRTWSNGSQDATLANLYLSSSNTLGYDFLPLGRIVTSSTSTTFGQSVKPAYIYAQNGSAQLSQTSASTEPVVGCVSGTSYALTARRAAVYTIVLGKP